MTAPELKPCPFCGGEAKRRTLPSDEFGNDGGDVIECVQCGASSHVEFGHKENLASTWNTRADASELVALVEAVKGIVSDAWGYGHLFDSPFHAKVHDELHDKLAAYEALQ